MDIKPLEGKFVLERKEFANTTDGGIYIPENAREEPSEGIVKAGKNEYIKPGDTVIFNEMAVREIDLGGDPLIILEEGDILAVVG